MWVVWWVARWFFGCAVAGGLVSCFGLRLLVGFVVAVLVYLNGGLALNCVFVILWLVVDLWVDFRLCVCLGYGAGFR